jgi:hypothetical protein
MIGSRQQLCHWQANRRGTTHTHCGPDLHVFERDAALRQTLPDPFSQCQRLLLTPLDQSHELLAPEAAVGALWKVLHQNMREYLQHLIANMMPMNIIDPLEAIEIKQKAAEGSRLATSG